MNGVDALALATGNDWRAIEAAAHAYASRNGRYQALTRWHKREEGCLVGEIAIPMKVGTVGGSLETNPSVRINSPPLRLAERIGACGRDGRRRAGAKLCGPASIVNGWHSAKSHEPPRSQRGQHCGCSGKIFETVVETLIESGEIKVWKAQEIAKNLSRKVIMPETADRQSAYGKIILLGEHAVVYGRPAIALPIPLAVEAAVRKEGDGINVLIPRWGIEQKVRPSAPGFAGIIATLMSQIGLAPKT